MSPSNDDTARRRWSLTTVLVPIGLAAVAVPVGMILMHIVRCSEDSKWAEREWSRYKWLSSMIDDVDEALSETSRLATTDDLAGHRTWRFERIDVDGVVVVSVDCTARHPSSHDVCCIGTVDDTSRITWLACGASHNRLRMNVVVSFDQPNTMWMSEHGEVTLHDVVAGVGDLGASGWRRLQRDEETKLFRTTFSAEER